jgi:hypothetical protein
MSKTFLLHEKRVDHIGRFDGDSCKAKQIYIAKSPFYAGFRKTQEIGWAGELDLLELNGPIRHMADSPPRIS